MTSPGKRIILAASFVRPGSRLCDVGTDHGFLPVYLREKGVCRSICATDINEKPLENARETFRNFGITDIPLYLCDGLFFENAAAVDTVTVLGMGGDVIAGIIENAPFLKRQGVHLILQPMTAAGRLREYLAENGFFVKQETAVCENGKVYSVMSVFYDGKRRALSPAEYRIGKLVPDGGDNTVYIKRQQRLCRELCESIKNIEEKRPLFLKEKAALEIIDEAIGEK